MTVYIPAGVVHQSFNDGDEDLCYFYAFAPPPLEPSKVETQGGVYRSFCNLRKVS